MGNHHFSFPCQFSGEQPEVCICMFCCNINLNEAGFDVNFRHFRHPFQLGGTCIAKNPMQHHSWPQQRHHHQAKQVWMKDHWCRPPRIVPKWIQRQPMRAVNGWREIDVEMMHPTDCILLQSSSSKKQDCKNSNTMALNLSGDLVFCRCIFRSSSSHPYNELSI